MISTEEVVPHLPAVRENRSVPRFRAKEGLTGELSGREVTVTDLSARGFQMVHGGGFRIGSNGTLAVKNIEFSETVRFRIRVVWSRLSADRSPAGERLYRTGVEIQDDAEGIAGPLGRLIRYCGEPDHESLSRKRRIALDRMLERIRQDHFGGRTLGVGSDDIVEAAEALSRLETLGESEVAERLEQAKKNLLSRNIVGAWNRETLLLWDLLDGRLKPDQVVAAREILTKLG